MWGYTPVSNLVWEYDTWSPDSGRRSAQEVVAMCDAEAKKKANNATEKLVQLLLEECPKEKPFENIEFIDPENNKPYAMAKRLAPAFCPDVRRYKQINYGKIPWFCRECSENFYGPQTCYQAAGLNLKERIEYRCASLRVF